MDNALRPTDVGIETQIVRPSWRSWLADRFGARATKLQEREKHPPLMAYLLTVAMSLASILVFAHSDIPVLFRGDFAAQVLAGVRIAVIITAVIIGDLCVVRSYARLEVLALRGARGLFIEHLAYMTFVLGVNISTYFTVSRADIHVLLSGAPIIPDQFLFWEELARALVVGWTALQLLITGDRLLVQWSTILKETAELLGGKALDWLKSLKIDLNDPASIFLAYGAVIDGMAHLPRRPKAQAQHAATLAAQQARRDEVIDALKGFGQQKLAEAKADGYAQARADFEAQLAGLQAQMAEILEGGLTRKPLRKPAESAAEGVYRALAALGIDLVKKATKRIEGEEKPRTKAGVALRGGWITSGDIVTLSAGKVADDAARSMAARLGDGYKSGTSNACPLRPVLRELADRNALIDPVLSAWNAADIAGPSTLEMAVIRD